MTVFGWDASDFDWPRGPMDMVAARNAGITFFTHKATEGTSVRHGHFGEVMLRARNAGIPVLGAYHVVRSPPNAAAEVDYCLAYVNSAAPWWRDFPNWFWQVDLEKWPYDPVPAPEGEAFADIIQERTGRTAVIYASRGQYGNELTGTSHELWNANYGSNPAGEFKVVYIQRGGDGGPGWAAYSGKVPIFWQYGSRTTIGRQPTCDANAYRGTLAQLMSQLRLDPPEDEMEQTDLLIGDTGFPGRRVGDVFVDLENLRNWLVSTPQTATVGAPPAGSRAAIMLAAAQQPVDPVALANALASNTAFINTLAQAVAQQMSGGTIALSGTYEPSGS